MFSKETSLKYLHKTPSDEGRGRMKDEELCRLVKRVDAEIHELYEVWMTNFRESRFMSDFLFTKDEKKAWLDSEPDFHKPIIS